MVRIHCENHPHAEMVPVRKLSNRSWQFICARCSSTRFVHTGRIQTVDYATGSGKILAGKNGKKSVYLFNLSAVKRFNPVKGMSVVFETGLVQTASSDYVKAAFNLKLTY